MTTDSNLLALFRSFGAESNVRRVIEDTDEAVFLLSGEDILNTRVGDLTPVLQALLHRKVWITTGDEALFGETQLLSSDLD
jgi:hypothetical protein